MRALKKQNSESSTPFRRSHLKLKRYANPSNYKTKKALICAKYVGLEALALVNFDSFFPCENGWDDTARIM